MTEKQLLQEYLDMEMNAVMAYSANWRMNAPKKGYEKEFAAAKERAEILEDLLIRIYDDDGQI